MPAKPKAHASLDLSRPQIMGILNVTPDSFSDGGRYADLTTAVQHGLEMVEQGAAIIDVGGESTRPGSQRVSAAEQKGRAVPVIAQLHQEWTSADQSHVAISIDTTRVEVAAAAIDGGAAMINDVSAGRESDGEMFALAAERDVPIVLMHMGGQPATMQQDPVYGDVVSEVLAFLAGRADAARRGGVKPEQIIIDPGIGFGKTLEHNLQLLAQLERFVATGYPVLLGASRKRFISDLMQEALGQPETPPDQRVGGTCAATVLGVLAGVTIFRVHDVLASRQALQIALAIRARR